MLISCGGKSWHTRYCLVIIVKYQHQRENINRFSPNILGDKQARVEIKSTASRIIRPNSYIPKFGFLSKEAEITFKKFCYGRTKAELP